ncbi:MAG: adenylate/guanylate cyclase domain-containing protein [Pseudomonadota bacterium]
MMTQVKTIRRLAAIVAADVCNYSRLVAEDEEGTIAALRALREDLIDTRIIEAGGRIANTAGDSLLIEFSSVVDALRFAIDAQDTIGRHNSDVEENRRIVFRMGVNLGDVIDQDGDILGDGVNIAARLEALAPPGGILISEDAYRQVRGKIDVDFEDIGPQTLKNIAQPVRAFRYGVSTPDNTTSLQPWSVAPSLPDIPSIAVLPFRSLGGADEVSLLASGLTEDIITIFSGLSGLFVTARNASCDPSLDASDLGAVASKLGVRYILQGSVRGSGTRVRISIELIDAVESRQVWAERYDRMLEDTFAIQDEISIGVATELQVQISEGEQARLRYTTTHNLEAWTYWARGLAHFRREVSKDGMGRAKNDWERALELDPNSAPLNAMLAFIHSTACRFGWWGPREEQLALTQRYVDAAMEIDPENGEAMIAQAFIHAQNKQHELAVSTARRAVDLTPGSADVAVVAAIILNFSGFPAEAKIQIGKAMRLSPIYPPWYLGDMGFSCRLLEQYDEAIALYREYARRSPGFGLVDLTIIYATLGRMEDARAEAKRLQDARPGFSILAWTHSQLYADSTRLEADIAALRAAGLPD